MLLLLYLDRKRIDWKLKEFSIALLIHLFNSALKEVCWKIIKMRAFAALVLAVALGVNSFAAAFLPAMLPKSYTEGMV